MGNYDFQKSRIAECFSLNCLGQSIFTSIQKSKLLLTFTQLTVFPAIETAVSIRSKKLNQRKKMLLDTSSTFLADKKCCTIEPYLFTLTNFHQGLYVLKMLGAASMRGQLLFEEMRCIILKTAKQLSWSNPPDSNHENLFPQKSW